MKRLGVLLGVGSVLVLARALMPRTGADDLPFTPTITVFLSLALLGISAALRPLVLRDYAPTPTSTPEPRWICSYNAYNCADFGTQAEAQACFDYCYPTHGTPKDRLDDDNDLIACENLP